MATVLCVGADRIVVFNECCFFANRQVCDRTLSDGKADMPIDRIRGAFEGSGLIALSIEEAFAFDA